MAEYLTVKDVANKLNIIPATVRNHITAGKLKATKINGAYIITKEDLNTFLKNRGAKHE